MRIHTLLIAGALAGLMATAGSARALEVGAPVHTVKVANVSHKHPRKHRTSDKHLAITKDGHMRSAGGTVSKSLIGKSRPSVRRSSKHHFKSSNASMKHNKKSSMKSNKNYQ